MRRREREEKDFTFVVEEAEVGQDEPLPLPQTHPRAVLKRAGRVLIIITVMATATIPSSLSSTSPSISLSIKSSLFSLPSSSPPSSYPFVKPPSQHDRNIWVSLDCLLPFSKAVQLSGGLRRLHKHTLVTTEAGCSCQMSDACHSTTVSAVVQWWPQVKSPAKHLSTSRGRLL